MRLSFTTVTFRDKSISEVYDIASRNKVTKIEWGGDIHLPPSDSASLQAVIDGQLAYGIKALSYGSYYKVGMNNSDKFHAVAHVAQRIGARIIRVWVGNKSSAKTSATELAAMVRELREMCDIVAQYGIVIAAEFHNNTYNDSGAAALKLIESVGRDNYKTYWQQLGKYKSDVANLKAIVGHIAAVHVFNQRSYDKRFSIAKSRKKWIKFIEIIANSGDVPYIIEFVKNDDVTIFEGEMNCLRELTGEKL